MAVRGMPLQGPLDVESRYRCRRRVTPSSEIVAEFGAIITTDYRERVQNRGRGASVGKSARRILSKRVSLFIGAGRAFGERITRECRSDSHIFYRDEENSRVLDANLRPSRLKARR